MRNRLPGRALENWSARHGFSSKFTWLLLAILLLAGPLWSQTLKVSPSALDFGSKVTTETGSNIYKLIFDNTGTETLNFTGEGITIDGPDAADFELVEAPTTTPLTTSAPPREVSIGFTPSSNGTKAATLSFTTNDPDFPTTTVALSGNGLPYRGTLVEGDYTGYGPGQSTIGAGGDFPSLEKAAQAISSRPLTGGGWTFLILNDLTEPNNSIIGQRNTNGNTITIRPAPDTSPTVTFTTETDRLNTQGVNFVQLPAHITIGGKVRVNDPSRSLPLEATHKIAINGSSVVGGTEKNLTFKNIQGLGATNAVHVLGNCDHVSISNCIFELYPAREAQVYHPGVLGTVGYSSSQNRNLSGVLLPVFEIPDHGSLTNCVFSSTSTDGTSIGYNNRPTDYFANSLPSSSVRIQNNIIRTNGRGIGVRFAKDPLITSNTIIINKPVVSVYLFWGHAGVGILCTGLEEYLPDQAQTNAQIIGNHIQFTGDLPTSVGLVGILVGSQYNSSAQYVIANNVITGLTAPVAEYGLVPRYGICNYANSLTTVTISHNSIDFHALSGTDDTTARNCAAISHGNKFDGFTGNSIIQNNIMRVAVPNAVAIGSYGSYSSYGGGGKIHSDNNNIYTTNGSLVGNVGNEYYPTLADWQTSTGQDLASISLDPFVPAGEGLGAWIGPADSMNPDVHFSSFPGAEYLAPQVAGVDTDFDGDFREGTEVIMGADEPPYPRATVGEWQLY